MYLNTWYRSRVPTPTSLEPRRQPADKPVGSLTPIHGVAQLVASISRCGAHIKAATSNDQVPSQSAQHKAALAMSFERIRATVNCDMGEVSVISTTFSFENATG